MSETRLTDYQKQLVEELIDLSNPDNMRRWAVQSGTRSLQAFNRKLEIRRKLGFSYNKEKKKGEKKWIFL